MKSPSYTKVKIRIPNKKSTGVFKIVSLRVPCVIDPYTGEELLTFEAVQQIERAKAKLLSNRRIYERKKNHKEK